MTSIPETFHEWVKHYQAFSDDFPLTKLKIMRESLSEISMTLGDIYRPGLTFVEDNALLDLSKNIGARAAAVEYMINELSWQQVEA